MSFAPTSNMNATKNHFLNYFIIALMFALVSCSSKTEETASEVAQKPIEEATYEISPKQFQSSNMALGKMEKKPFHQIVKTKGMIDVPPENRAAVSCYFGGIVKHIKLLTGEKVQKGQVLFTLENLDYVQMQQDYLEAKGQLTYLKSDYERQKNLAKDSVASQKSYLKAESDYTVTRVKVESLSKKLSLMNINTNTLTLENIRTAVGVQSPISGYVTEVAVSQGTFLNPSEPAVSIVNTDHLHLELNIFEKDLAKVKIGQPIRFSIQEDIRNDYEASVYLVNKTVDAKKRTVGIHGHLRDEKLTSMFNPGMYVEADIYTNSKERMALPREALVDVEGKFYVLVLRDQSDAGYTFEKKAVQTGVSNNTEVEILNAQDFKENAAFLVRGAFNLITE